MFWASRAPAVTASAVAVPAIDSERSTSAASDLTWLAASAEAVTSVVCASRAPARTDAAVAAPAAESVRSTSADSDLIWLAARRRPTPASSARRGRWSGSSSAAPVPTAVRAASTSAEVSFSWAPTSEETVSSDCCAARAPVWMVSLVLTTRLVSERSASSTCDLMPEDSILGARHQAVAGLAAAAFDAAGHGFDARAEQVLELRDARVDVAGDRADPGLDALVDFLEPRRDGVGQLGAAAVDGFGHVGDALVDRRDRLRGAVGQRGGEVGQAASRSTGSPAPRRRSATSPACRGGRRWFR